MTEEQLSKAAAESADYFASVMESGSSHSVVPSDKLKRKVERLNRRANHPILYPSLQRAASVVLAVLLTGAVWLATDTEAQAAFIKWIRNVYQDHVVYQFYSPSSSQALPELELTLLPEGFEETDSFYSEDLCYCIYENGNQLIIFRYQTISEGGSKMLFTEGYTYEVAHIGEIAGDYYGALDETERSALVWIDEGANAVFQISANLEKADMIALAESIQ